ncbi:type I secretion outer membrane protein, TolC family [Fuerstiella marisgermanici]|uniref:Type I secretion outer membrane protein, TolC family n=2 Tax=Fuerstiella marisgermanici TaxID=1891926 RepID=A0A1P8WHH8_9PLAN|nr:type I secretion outer membrane protein, TolC family [Fuerstiella marisgermanici]
MSLLPGQRSDEGSEYLQSGSLIVDEKIGKVSDCLHRMCARSAIRQHGLNHESDTAASMDMKMPLRNPAETAQSQPTRPMRLSMAMSLVYSMVFSPILFSGCAASNRQWEKTVNNDTTEIDCITQQIDNPNPQVFQEVSMTSEPVTALSVAADEITYVDRTLDDVLRLAMQHSSVLRDIGGIVLRSPDTVNTGYSTQLQETDPRFGMEAALSAFDAQLSASSTFNNNNRIYNNNFFAGGTTAFTQDLHDYQVELSKRTATGSLLAVRSTALFDANNAPANTFRSAWDTWLEGEIRQPLLQGGGAEFNRIAGPGATPGIYNGVLIAKANADINHTEFMASLRDYVSNVENAYWDLYLSYRELDARKKAMEKALVVWNKAKAMDTAGNFKIADEALARQQYYQLKADVDDALSGRLLQGTQTQNGSSGGTVQMTGGVLAAERRLRLLVGMPAADGQLMRPSEEPTMANISFDWHSCMNESIRQRPELQRQHLNVKKREMELLAAKNFLNPRLDAIGRYRWRGFGDHLIGNDGGSITAPNSSLGNLADGDQQEWTVGVELTVPIGYRKAHAAVQNAELKLARERAIQKEQQREVVSNLSGAIADAVRAFQSLQNNLNQYLAARDYLQALETREGNSINDTTDRILDAQRRLVQAEIQFFRARSEYAVALKNVHYEKGSLLRYKDLRVAGATGYDGAMLQQDVYMEGEPLPVETPVDMTNDPAFGSPSTTAPPATEAAPEPVPAPAPELPDMANTPTPATKPVQTAQATPAAASPVNTPAPAATSQPVIPVDELAPMLEASPSASRIEQSTKPTWRESTRSAVSAEGSTSRRSRIDGTRVSMPVGTASNNGVAPKSSAKMTSATDSGASTDWKVRQSDKPAFNAAETPTHAATKPGTASLKQVSLSSTVTKSDTAVDNGATTPLSSHRSAAPTTLIRPPVGSTSPIRQTAGSTTPLRK